MEEYKLSKPIEFDGKKIEKLSLNLEGLTGQDIMICEQEFRDRCRPGEIVELIEVNKLFLAILAARAAKAPYDLFAELSAKDFCRITVEVQAFLAP
ncbi:hypothetical protein J23TS9_06010 [Paenibacillus sp. J23TS9]|uniref:phage tail assembly protein n=1 Tax=Paenibacillus sp. J23TS9 TaxID=2807193 RepID=UPI001B090904|nr:phage tail assembly protein [Paenibacillus sp. J23TS9]GIP25471.1 hypothetical protein J23TS9_06010 [Paenibacillus sp. J23TS9]